MKLGKIIKVVSYKKRSYEVCIPGFPSEYCSTNNLICEVKVLTDNDEIFTIKEEYIGEYTYHVTIFDKNNNIVGTPEDLDYYNRIKKETKKNKKLVKRK